MSEENLVPIPSDYAWGPGDDGDPTFVGVGFENGEVQVPTIRAENVLGYRDFSFQDPNVQPSVETGSDVLALLDGKRYGFQVTLLHTDEGLTAGQKGSELRREESKYKDSTRPYATWGILNPMGALQYRITEKCSKTYPPNDFDEEVLLIVAALPQMGAIGATMVLEIGLDVDKMNAELSPTLERSRYDCAYLFGMMGLSGSWVFEWQKGHGWRRTPRAADT